MSPKSRLVDGAHRIRTHANQPKPSCRTRPLRPAARGKIISDCQTRGRDGRKLQTGFSLASEKIQNGRLFKFPLLQRGVVRLQSLLQMASIK